MPKTANLSEFKVSGRKQGKRDAFLTSIIEKIEERIYAECLGDDHVFVNIESNDGWIEVYMKSDGTCEVVVCHSKNEHESPMLESTITGMLPDWWSIHTRAEEDEREEQEFQDYLWANCRYW